MSSAVVSREGWESIGSLAVVERAQRVRFLDGTDSGSTSCLFFYFLRGSLVSPAKCPQHLAGRKSSASEVHA